MVFFTVLLIILFAPIVMSKLRIPHIIGMVLAGVIIGPYGFNILERDASFELFGRVGLLYIMFLAGIEMDLQGLKNDIRKIGIFSLASFLTPFIMMYLAGVHFLGYSSLASVILSCVMAANTLIAYPIVARFGLQKHTTTTISVGASMTSLLLALIVVTAVEGSILGGTGVAFWALFVAKFVLYCAAIQYFLRIATRWFLRSYSDSVMQYIFVLGMMFFSAAISEFIGIDGIFGAFFSGLVLNRFIPQVSPLMNRIEFIGNAIFIPYFLIGVGMLINIGLLFEPSSNPTSVGIILTVVTIVIVGTLGKAIAAYASCFAFRLPWQDGHLMFGLTSAHAAGGIAIVMIGMKLNIMGDDMLNGVVIMILFTCIISTIVTDYASRRIVITDDLRQRQDKNSDDEKILIPVKYPETCNTLVNLAAMMRNRDLNRGLIALNVVYDDDDAERNQMKGHKLLESVVSKAAESDIRVQTQVRLATNIANGIKHAFKEFDCSEIIMGAHIHDNSRRAFWGEFAQSVFNGLSRQIIITRCTQPFSTLSAMRIAVPSRAEFEPGFYRWLERLSRMAHNIGCRIIFHGRVDSLNLIDQYISHRHPNVRAEYVSMPKWKGLIDLMENTTANEMLVVVTARKGTVSYKAALANLPEEMTEHYKGTNYMILFPDQFGPAPDTMTFAEAQHTEQLSAYHEFILWWRKQSRRIRKMVNG
jgi:Kef-type K+ transport system membrane component KefB/nucleotide-binding universal stress UspA family protein